jgi:glycosyltransferase involved in cell wall biosynthesis
MPTPHPRLCFVGPLLGRHPGYVTTQGEILSDRFTQAGYRVVETSSERNRYLRAADIARTILRHRSDIDVLVINTYGGPSFVVEDVASWLGRRLGHRVVMVLRGGAIPDFVSRHLGWTRRVFRRAHGLVAPSTYLSRMLERYGFAAHVIPNVIDVSQYPYRHRRAVTAKLFWMRTFHDAWNPLMAVRVLALLSKRVPTATLSMGGQDKGLESEAKRLAEELGVSCAVRFPGFLDMAAKRAEGEAADIFISTNRIDNMPVAVLEAGALGLPVISTDVGGIRDLLTDRETGLLVRDDDDQSMVEAILELLRAPELAGRLSANGRELAERSSWPRVRLEWEDLFAQLLSPSAPASTRLDPRRGA